MPTVKTNQPAAVPIAGDVSKGTATGAADSPPENPSAGGSYIRNPDTGELTCVTPATGPASTAPRVQDPVTGVITRIKRKE